MYFPLSFRIELLVKKIIILKFDADWNKKQAKKNKLIDYLEGLFQTTLNDFNPP